MVITWYGQACFKLQSGSSTVMIDPFDKSIGLNPPKGEAQLLLVTHDHYDHNNTSTIKGDPFIIEGPGEYERAGIRVLGIPSFHDDNEGKDRGLNTIYRITLEDMVIVHLGDLGQKELTDEQVEEIGNADVLMVPVGGEYTIDGSQAIEVVNQVEPNVVIPMHYKVKGLKINLNPIDDFLKALGKEGAKAQDKFTFKKRDLPTDRMDVVVLNP